MAKAKAQLVAHMRTFLGKEGGNVQHRSKRILQMNKNCCNSTERAGINDFFAVCLKEINFGNDDFCGTPPTKEY